MKNLIRLSCVLVLSAVVGCARDNASSSITPPEAAAEPVTSSTVSEQPVAAAPVRPPAASAAEPSSRPNDTLPSRASRVDGPSRNPAARMQTVPAGTSLTVVMSDEVSTSKSKEGDAFRGALADALIVDGRVVAERGADVVGRVDDIVMPGKVKGRAQLTLVLTDLSANGREYRIKTEPFVAIAVDNKERDAAIIAGGAGVGAAIGAITKGKKGAAIGAILGGGGGTAAVLATPGRAMKIEPETKVNFVLDNEVRLPVIRNRSS